MGRRTVAAVRGLLAGAAGTTALDAVTYLDMAVRGRPASTTPQRSVQRLADTLHIGLGKGDPGGTAAPASGRCSGTSPARAWRPATPRSPAADCRGRYLRPY